MGKSGKSDNRTSGPPDIVRPCPVSGSRTDTDISLGACPVCPGCPAPRARCCPTGHLGSGTGIQEWLTVSPKGVLSCSLKRAANSRRVREIETANRIKHDG